MACRGVTVPKSPELDGLNVWPVFLGKSSLPERSIYYGGHAIREGRWKLLDGKLYDLQTDLQEHIDVSAEHPDICVRLAKQLEVWK